MISGSHSGSFGSTLSVRSDASRSQGWHRASPGSRSRTRPEAVGAGIERRERVRRVPRVTGEELGEPRVVEEGRRLELRLAEGVHLADESAARQLHREGRVLHRPHRGAMVGEGIVGGMLRGERPHAPPGEEIGREEARDQARQARALHQPAAETVARVAGDRPHQYPAPIDGHPEVTLVLHPEHSSNRLFSAFASRRRRDASSSRPSTASSAASERLAR